MKSRLTALAASLALGASLVFVSTGVAAAASPSLAGTLRQGRLRHRVRRREGRRHGRHAARLRRLRDQPPLRDPDRRSSSKISASKVMTSSDAAALQSEISSTRSGLTSLKATIDAETSIPALKLDIVKIATQFRVYLLVVPQVNLVNAADAVAVAQTKFATVNTTLQARIDAENAAGKNTAAAQADLDAMNASVTAAANLASPLPAALLPLTPAEYNGGTAGPILTNARTALGQARDDLKSALADAKACRDALK